MPMKPVPSIFHALTASTALALCILSQSLCAAPGDPDLSFGTNGVVSGTFTSIGVQSDGKILAVSGQSVRRFLPNGSADATFAGGTGVVTIPFTASAHERALAVQPDDKIVLAGTLSNDFAIMRLNPNGTPDNTFGSQGVQTVNMLTYLLFPLEPRPPVTFFSVDTGLGVLVLLNGDIVAVGTAAVQETTAPGAPTKPRMGACTVSSTGAYLDSAAAGNDQFYMTLGNFTLMPNGNVFIASRVFGIVAGIYTPRSGVLGGVMVKDIHYPNEIDDEAFGAAARPDGSVLLAGSAGNSGNFLAGLSSASGWQFDSPKNFSQSLPLGKSIALQPDGRIVLAGTELARYMTDGSADPSFRTLDVVGGVKTVALQSDGKILTAGNAMRRFEVSSTSATIAVEQPEGSPLLRDASLDFGTLNSGGRGIKIFTVRNPSALPLRLWKAVSDGPSAAEVSADLPVPLTIPPGGSTTFTLRWAPLSYGPLSATFHLVNSDSAWRSVDIPLTGYALTTAPEIEVQANHTLPLISGQPAVIHLSHFRPQAALTFTNAGQPALNFTPLVIDGNASAFAYTSPLPATLAAAASHTSSIQYLPGENPVSAVLHFGNNDPDENPLNISVTGDPSTSSATWRQSWFSGAPINSPTGDADDYDGDGIPNILEYATFGNPVQSGPLAVTLVKKSTVLELTFTRPLEATIELLYELEWSDTLAAASWKTLGTSSTVLSDDGIRQQVKFTVPSGTGHRFVRLKVTRVP
jgi:uncharacterized delta-60 repeat protein